MLSYEDRVNFGQAQSLILATLEAYERNNFLIAPILYGQAITFYSKVDNIDELSNLKEFLYLMVLGAQESKDYENVIFFGKAHLDQGEDKSDIEVIHLLARSYHELNRYKEARQTAEAGLSLFNVHGYIDDADQYIRNDLTHILSDVCGVAPLPIFSLN